MSGKKEQAPAGKVYGYLYLKGSEKENEQKYLLLRDFPVAEEHLYLDRKEKVERKQGDGLQDDRQEFNRLLARLKPEDLVVISDVGQLGDDPEEALARWQRITKEKSAHIAVAEIPLMNTRQAGADLSGTSAVALAMCNFFHGEAIRRSYWQERHREGIAAARERGVRFGRPYKPVPETFTTVKAAWKRREINSREAAKQLGVAQATFLRWTREIEDEI